MHHFVNNNMRLEQKHGTHPSIPFHLSFLHVAAYAACIQRCCVDLSLMATDVQCNETLVK